MNKYLIVLLGICSLGLKAEGNSNSQSEIVFFVSCNNEKKADVPCVSGKDMVLAEATDLLKFFRKKLSKLELVIVSVSTRLNQLESINQDSLDEKNDFHKKVLKNYLLYLQNKHASLLLQIKPLEEDLKAIVEIPVVNSQS